MTNLDNILKSRNISLPRKVNLVKAMVFPVVTFGCEIWTISAEELKFWIVVLDKYFERPLDSKDIRQFSTKGNQSWIIIGRTDAEAKGPVFWPLDVKNWLTEKDPGDGKDWRQEDKGTAEDKIVCWHHQLDGHEFKEAPGVGDGQGSLASCSPWGHREPNMTEW